MAAWQNPENFALWLTFVFTILIVLMSTFVYFTRLYFIRILKEQQKLQTTIVSHQQQLLEDSILVQERERNRIAADLHDDLISKLNISLLSLHTNPKVEELSTLLQDSIFLARRITHDLSPPLLEQSSLYELLEEFVDPIKTHLEIALSYSLNTEETLPNPTKLQIFRIIQEVINNILKHAQASQLKVHLHLGKRYVGLKIIDNGIGFDTDKKSQGLGLKNIRLRSQSLQGAFRFQSKPQQGSSFLFFKKHSI
jgi:signal transduction histidine kinase